MSANLRALPFVAALLVAACTAAPPAESPSPAPTSGPTASPAVIPSPDPTATPPGPSPAPTASAGEPSPSVPASPSPAPATPTTAPTASPTTAPGGGWSDLARVSERSYAEVSLAIDGGLTMLAHAAAVLNGAIFHVTNDEGNMAGRWTRERVSSPPRGYVDEQPVIAIDEASGMYIAFTRMYDSELGRFAEGIYLVSRTDGGEWSDEQLLVGEGANSPSLVVRDGRVHLAWVQGHPFDIIEDDPEFPVMYGVERGEGMRSVQLARNGDAPQLELDGEGRAHVAFGSPYWIATGINYAVGPADASGAFSVEQLAGTGEYDRAVALTLDPAGRPHLAWRNGSGFSDDRGVSYSSRNGGTWSAPVRVLDDALDIALTADVAGGLHLGVTTSAGTWYGYGAGGAWQTERLSRDPSLWLDLAIPVGPHGGAEVHLLLLTGREGESNGMWYGVARPE